MKFLEIYKTTRHFEINQPQEVISNGMARFSKHCTVGGNQIDILVEPSLFDPIAGNGNIRLHLKPTEDDSRTDITCEITPTATADNNFHPVIFVLSVWTVIMLLMSLTIATFLLIIGVWAFIMLLFHISQLLSRGKLEHEIKSALDHLA